MKKDANNYRSISLASSLCKLFTSLVTERMQKGSENRKLLGQEQAGCRKNVSCSDHAFVLNAIISRYLAEEKRLILTFVDYEKAFDRVDQSLLWKELGQYDINEEIFSMIENLYRKTKACVDVNESLTDVFECRVGVRQGDNHSPLLFIIFMNDFQKYVRSNFTGISLELQRGEQNVYKYW